MEKNELKERDIKIIESLYPADSGYRDNEAIGQELLLRAIYYCWRDLPENILHTYRQLCEYKERMQGK